MLKLENGGSLNEKRIVAVVKKGPNWVALLDFGHEVTLTDKEAQELRGEEDNGK